MSIKQTKYIKDSEGNKFQIIPPIASENNFGGIKAKTRTTETSEVAIDPTTGKAYVQEQDLSDYIELESKVTEQSNKIVEQSQQIAEINQKIESGGIGGGNGDITLDEDGNIVIGGVGGGSGVDTNTTYTLSLIGNVLKLVGSDGSSQEITLPASQGGSITDTNTTYTISLNGNVLSLNGSDGSKVDITLPTSQGGESTPSSESWEQFTIPINGLADGTSGQTVLVPNLGKYKEIYIYPNLYNPTATTVTNIQWRINGLKVNTVNNPTTKIGFGATGSQKTIMEIHIFNFDDHCIIPYQQGCTYINAHCETLNINSITGQTDCVGTVDVIARV